MMFCKRIFLMIILFTGNLFCSFSSYYGDQATLSKEEQEYADYLRNLESENKIKGLLENLPGTSRWNPLYTASTEEIPGRSKWQPLYITAAKPGLMRTLGKKFVKVIQDSEKIQEMIRESNRSLAEWAFKPRDTWQTFKDIAYIGALGVTIPAILLITLKGGSAAIDVIKHKLTIPKVEIIEKEAGPIYGRMDRLARWWAGYKTPSIIFDQSVKDHLVEIQEKTKNIKDHILSGDKSVTYTNLLLYGPPGTGKTMFAKALADYANMDFLPVTAASLMQDPVAFSNIVEMANRSSYGTIIFIDEADALFLNRNELLKSSAPDALAQYKALNHILAIIGKRNNKFMVVAATNFPHVIDEAMNRRFPEKVGMPLPNLETRVALLKLYIDSILFNEKSNSKEFVKAARILLPESFINQLAVQLAGFSPSEIGSLIEGIRSATYATKDRMVTKNIINDAIARALVSHQAFIKSKEQEPPAPA